MTNKGTLDERYLTWLYSQIGPVTLKNPERTFWKLTRRLHSKEFIWFVPNDGNRVADGLDIRKEYVKTEEGGEVDEDWMAQGCSFLEMLIALGRRAAFEADGEASDWFWTFIENLNMDMYTDAVWDHEVSLLVDDILDMIIQREYRPDGSEGLFPLRNPRRDQRDVEIWKQLSAYLLENTTFA